MSENGAELRGRGSLSKGLGTEELITMGAMFC